jgi:hypothetical protein
MGYFRSYYGHTWLIPEGNERFDIRFMQSFHPGPQLGGRLLFTASPVKQCQKHSHVLLFQMFHRTCNILISQNFCAALHSLATSSYLVNSTSSPHSFNHPIISSIIPITCAMPDVSGCNTSGKMKFPFPALSSEASCSRYRKLKRDFHIERMDEVGTYPCELGAAGRNCIGVT